MSGLNHPPWNPPTQAYHEPFAAKYDLTIIGATLPAIHLANILAESGLSVLIIEKKQMVGVPELRNHGFLQLGLFDNSWRVALSMGEDAAYSIFQASIRGSKIVSSLVPKQHTGWVLAKDNREKEEVYNVQSLLLKWNLSVEELSTEQLHQLSPSGAFVNGFTLPEEGCIDPSLLSHVLIEKAIQNDVRIVCGTPIQKIEDINGGSRIYHGQTQSDTELVIFMEHEHLEQLDPFFHDRIGTIRTQFIAYERHTPFLPFGCSAQYGYLAWRDVEKLRILSGCRWATPHLEIGETDETITVPVIESALVRTVQQCFGQTEVPIHHRWSMIEQRAYDGLPLVGEIPGRDHMLSCTAFQGRSLGLGFAAAESIGQLILYGTAPHLPPYFSLRRLLP